MEMPLLLLLLQLLLQLPVGGNKCCKALDCHSFCHPSQEVDTGDPACPAEAQLAKCVKHQSSSCAKVGNGAEKWTWPQVQSRTRKIEKMPLTEKTASTASSMKCLANLMFPAFQMMT